MLLNSSSKTGTAALRRLAGGGLCFPFCVLFISRDYHNPWKKIYDHALKGSRKQERLQNMSTASLQLFDEDLGF